MSALEFRQLGPEDAPKLALLIAENAQAIKRGAPRRPDEVHAEGVLTDKSMEFVGVYVEEELVGFAAFCDLPDLVYGLRIGQMEEIYVMPAHQHKGIGKALVECVAHIGKERDWVHLRWLVTPNKDLTEGLYTQIGELGDKQNYIVPIGQLINA